MLKSIIHISKKCKQIFNTRNIKKTIPMHIIINLLNTSDKHNILKTERGKKIHYKQRNKDEDDGRFLTSNSAVK